jgi:NAD(P)-dependent dehydrogenase (short-subunit alcohol dehydrogenase family)
MNSKVAVVTGVSSGIGRQIAQALAQRGYRVYGSARNPERVSSIAGVNLLRLDVTSDTSVAEFAAKVLGDEGRIDLVVNNAGSTIEGSVEETAMEEVQHLFETNFFGVIRVTRSFLSTMRQQKSGRIITIGSVAGFLPKPFEAVYAASKHALEAWSESLDHEVRHFGIRSILIEPGFIKTAIEKNSASANMRIEAYRDHRAFALRVMSDDIQRGDTPESVAQVVLQAAESTSPNLRYLAGKGSLALRLQRTWLPASLFSAGLRRKFRLP